MKVIKYITAIFVGIVFFVFSVYMPEYMMKYNDRNRFSSVIEIRDDTLKNVYKYTIADREKIELLSKRYEGSLSIVKDIPNIQNEWAKMYQMMNESYLTLMEKKIIPEIELPDTGTMYMEHQKIIDINYPEIYGEFYNVYYDESYGSDYRYCMVTVDKETGKPLLLSCYNIDFDYEELNAKVMLENWLEYLGIDEYEELYRQTRTVPAVGSDIERVFAMGVLVRNSDGSVIVAEASYSRNNFNIGCYYEESYEKAKGRYIYLTEEEAFANGVYNKLQ